MKRTIVGLLVVCGTFGCGGGSPSAPSGGGQPSTAPAANRAPSVTSVTGSPAFGVQDFTTFTFNAAATDPDADALTYTWDIAGNAKSGQTAQMLFGSGGDGVATVTVTDNRGGSATGKVEFTVGSMSGRWLGNLPPNKVVNAQTTMTMNLTQFGAGVVTGTASTVAGNGTVGPTGEPGKINANGDVELRIKVAPFTDFYFRGRMDGTGRTIMGALSGSGFNGEPAVLLKQ
jgi:carbon monoxide dehydrogenase subunit G